MIVKYMEVKLGYILTALVFLIIGWGMGWLVAHNVVATECKRLGRFYVGSATYHCTQIDTPPKFQDAQ